MVYLGRVSSPGERLRRARIAAGYSSAAEAARAFGFHPQNVRDNEADRRGISPERAASYGRAYRVTPEYILFGTGDPSPTADSRMSLQSSPLGRNVPVIGEVRAGAWSEVTGESVVESYVPVTLPEYSRAELFGLRVSGRSMDQLYPDGAVVVVCPAQEAGVRIGDIVVVRRHRGPLAETTLKEVVVREDGVFLWPRSTDPAHQEPIPLPARDTDNQDGHEIIGVVVGAFLPGGPRTGPLLNL